MDNARTSNNAAAPPVDPRTVISRRVRQDTSGENWLRRLLIFLLIAWMIVAVVFPVYQLVDQSLHAEVAITVFGDQDVRISGRRVHFDKGTYYIDTTAFDQTDGRIADDGMSVDLEDGLIRELVCEKVVLYAEPLRVRAVRVRLDGERISIDGIQLPSEDYQKVVRRWIGLSNFKKYFSNEALYYSVYNSLYVSLMTTVIAVVPHARSVRHIRTARRFARDTSCFTMVRPSARPETKPMPRRPRRNPGPLSWFTVPVSSLCPNRAGAPSPAWDITVAILMGAG